MGMIEKAETEADELTRKKEVSSGMISFHYIYLQVCLYTSGCIE